MEQTKTEAAVHNKGGKRVASGQSGGKAFKIILILAVLLAAAYCGLCAYASSLDTFAPNRHINGVDVGGLTVSQAQERLETELPAQVITLTDGASQTQTTLTVADLGYSAENFAGDAQFWMEQEQSQSFLRKGWAYLAYATGRWPGGANWPDADEAALSAAVERLQQELDQAPIHGSYAIGDSSLSITKGQDGRKVDPESLCAALRDISAYSKNDYLVPFAFTVDPAQGIDAKSIHDEIAAEMRNAGYDAKLDAIIPEQVGAEFDAAAAQAALDKAAPGESITVPAVIERPAVTAAELEKVLFRDVLGECKTKVGGTASRKTNVQLSASTIHNYVMNTGDVFSYNEAVGKRTAENGYKPAPAYVKGETVDEIGGGICQTSSTLYLACLRGNLEITERYAHRYVPSYIAAGMDATVSWGGPDYKFTNNTDYPIRIVTTYENSYLTVKILGTNVDGSYAKVTNEHLSTTAWETVYEEDPTLAPGTEKEKTSPYTGSKWRTYRHVYAADGTLLSSGYEATSDYKVRNKVILRGPALTPTDPSVPVTGPAELPGEVTAPVTPPAETAPVPEIPGTPDGPSVMEQPPEI